MCPKVGISFPLMANAEAWMLAASRQLYTFLVRSRAKAEGRRSTPSLEQPGWRSMLQSEPGVFPLPEPNTAEKNKKA
jgi:hypothetical protein